ncbi:MAG: N-acetylmuramoyl-L-alanine amidase [Armatimonadota bacterium]
MPFQAFPHYRLLALTACCLLAGGGACPRPGWAQTASTRVQVLGVTIEPGESASRITLRCSGALTPRIRVEKGQIVVELPGAASRSLPPELPVDAGGIVSLRSSRSAQGVRIELQVARPLGARLVSPAGARDLVLEIGGAPGSAAPEPKPEPTPPVRPEPKPEPGPEPEPVTPTRPEPTVPTPTPVRPAPPLRPEPKPRPEEPGVQLTGVELVRVGSRVRVKLQTTGPVTVSEAFVGTGAPRYILDVRGAVLAMPETPRPGLAGTPVRQVRVGQNSRGPDIARVVLDLRSGTQPRAVAPAGEQVAQLIYPGAPAPGTAPPRPVRRYVIALDAGHGGRDSGAVGPGGLYEKTVALDVTLRVARQLRELGHEVHLSREGDRTLDPPQRAAWIRNTESDILVSIHCDAIEGRPSISGTTTYFHHDHTPSRSLAERVQENLVDVIDAYDLGVRSDYTRYRSGFYVLRTAKRPAVLIETGYISHAPTARKMADPDYREKVASGISQGLLHFLAGSGTREARSEGPRYRPARP